jgi:hypothetical protein
MHRSIGALTFLNKSKLPRVGSGVLISKNLVLTVAHNIYDLENSSKQKDKSDTKLKEYELDKSTYLFYAGGTLGEKYY